MFIHYSNYTHRIPNASFGLIFQGAYIWEDILVSLQGAYIRGNNTRDYMAHCCLGLDATNDFILSDKTNAATN